MIGKPPFAGRLHLHGAGKPVRLLHHRIHLERGMLEILALGGTRRLNVLAAAIDGGGVSQVAYLRGSGGPGIRGERAGIQQGVIGFLDIGGAHPFGELLEIGIGFHRCELRLHPFHAIVAERHRSGAHLLRIRRADRGHRELRRGQTHQAQHDHGHNGLHQGEATLTLFRQTPVLGSAIDSTTGTAPPMGLDDCFASHIQSSPYTANPSMGERDDNTTTHYHLDYITMACQRFQPKISHKTVSC